MYSQGVEVFASQILGIAVISVIFDKITNKSNKTAKVCIPIIALCIPCILNTLYFYESIYVDVILGIIIGYIFYQLYNENNKKVLYISVAISFAVLALTKATGFYMALIILASIAIQKIVEIFLEYKKEKIKLNEIIKKQKGFFLSIIILTIITVIIWSSWQLLASKVVMEKNILELEEEKVTVKEALTSIFTGFINTVEENYEIEASNRIFIHALLSSKSIVVPIGISILTYIFLVALLNIYMLKKIIPGQEKDKFIKYLTIIKIGLFLYLLFLQLAYIMKFGRVGMIEHHSIERYTNSYLLAELIWMISIFLEYCNLDIKKQNVRYIVLTIVILIFTPIYSITNATIFSSNYNMQIKSKVYYLEKQADKLKEILPENSKLYVIYQASDKHSDNWKLRYYLTPYIKTRITQKIDKELEKNYKKNGKNLKQEWTEILRNDFEYLYIIESDMYFNDFAKDIFLSKIENNTLYKIEKKDNENIQLKKIMESIKE